MEKIGVGIVYLWALAALGALIHAAVTGTIPIKNDQILGFYVAVLVPWALVAFRWARAARR
jgi:hypothetical protein